MVTQKEINGYFIEAIRRLKAEGNTQKDIVEKAGLAQNAISKIKNGQNNCGDETIQKLCKAFRLNPDFFYGKSRHLTLLELKRAKLDEDIAESQTLLSRMNAQPVPQSHTDHSSLMNAALAAKDETIVSLKRELQTKDDLIQSLRDQLAAKDQLITEQKVRLIDYRKIIDSHEGITNYPFPIGAADNQNQNKNRKNV